MENVLFVSDYGTMDELLVDGGAETFTIIKDDKEIGIISLQTNGSDSSIYLELIQLKEQYQRKGYGTKIINKIKNMGTTFGMEFIDGECRYELIKFYRNLGADFTNRRPMMKPL